MHQALKEAATVCKTIARNGYDAHIVNAPLQERLLASRRAKAVDIACEADLTALGKIFPKAELVAGNDDDGLLATMQGKIVLVRIYPIEMAGAGHPELSLVRITPTIVGEMEEKERQQLRLSACGSNPGLDGDAYEGFAIEGKNLSDAPIRFVGLPDETLRHNYLLAIRALRMAANFDVPIERNTWFAILRARSRVLDYCPAWAIMDEWRKVAAESMHRFVRLMYDAHLLQGIVPEVAALASLPQTNKDGEEVSVFDHTIECMKHYPEEGFHYDWLGTMAMFFHDVGKLYTCEYFDGNYTFYQHHRVGAKVTRKILRRLHFDQEDIDLICHLVDNHMRFHFMMTDRGIRRFKALDEYPRLIAMARADLESREDSYTSFNHNMKYLDRADTPEQMLEPLLNGNQIMTETKLAPGPLVGMIRDALLQAQIAGEVTDLDSAKAFVQEYAKKSVG